MSTNDRISVDGLLDKLGRTGRFQMWQAFLVSLSNVTIAFHLLSFIFVAQPVSHVCKGSDEGNVSGATQDSCELHSYNSTTNTSTTARCQAWSYPVHKQHSIVSEWDLVCSDTFLARLPQSLFVAGQGIGAILFSNLSDKFGRRPISIASQVLSGFVGLALAFVPNIAWFLVLRLFHGICQQGMVVAGYTLLMEAFPPARRMEAGAMYSLAWALSCVAVTPVAYFLRHMTWRCLQGAFVSVSLTAVFDIIFLDESLRWLITNQKYDRANALLEKAAKMNNVDVPLITFNWTDKREMLGNQLRKPLVISKDNTTEEKEDMNYSCLDLFRTRFMLTISMVMWFTWLTDVLTSFSLYLTASSLADDFFLNYFLNALAEMPAPILFLVIGKKFGRRKFFILFHMIAAVCLLTATAIRALTAESSVSTVATVFAFLGKIGNVTCFSALLIYTPEIYPTNIRTVGLGAGSMAGRVGGCIAPFISILAAAVPWVPGTIYGVMSLLTACLNYYLPETEGREMPQTINDVKQWDGNIRAVRKIPTDGTGSI